MAKNARRHKTEEFALLETPAVDYLTLVSKDIAYMRELFWERAMIADEPIVGNINALPFRAVSCAGMYLGPIPRWKQNDRVMLQIPGLKAHYVARGVELQEDETWCTRVDVQITLPESEGVSIEKLYEVMTRTDAYPWRQPGRPPRVTNMRNSEGGETLYIGARTADVMQRVYRKKMGLGNYVRWEVEIKGRLCKGLTAAGFLKDESMQSAFCRAILLGWPGKVEQEMMAFAKCLQEGTGEVVRSDYVSQEDRTLQWLTSVVFPALRKALDGRYRQDVIDLMKQHSIPVAYGEERREDTQDAVDVIT